MRYLFTLAIILLAAMVSALNTVSAQSTISDLSMSNATGTHVQGSLKSRNAGFVSDINNNGSASVIINIGDKSFSIQYGINRGILQFRTLKVTGVPSGIQVKSQADDNTLRLLHSALAATSRSDSALSPVDITQQTLDFLVDMIPIGEQIKDISIDNRSQSTGQQGFTPICRSIGAYQFYNFTDYQSTHTGKALVGDPVSECLGLCGAKCVGSFTRDRVYTQECLNHDLCTGYNQGHSFGFCADEFNAAIPSYFSRNKCPFNIVGLWRGTFTADGQGTGQFEIYFYKDMSTGEPYQTWNITGDRVTLKDTLYGCDYIGIIADDNLSMSGIKTCTRQNGISNGEFKLKLITRSL